MLLTFPRVLDDLLVQRGEAMLTNVRGGGTSGGERCGLKGALHPASTVVSVGRCPRWRSAPCGRSPQLDCAGEGRTSVALVVKGGRAWPHPGGCLQRQKHSSAWMGVGVVLVGRLCGALPLLRAGGGRVRLGRSALSCNSSADDARPSAALRVGDGEWALPVLCPFCLPPPSASSFLPCPPLVVLPPPARPRRRLPGVSACCSPPLLPRLRRTDTDARSAWMRLLSTLSRFRSGDECVHLMGGEQSCVVLEMRLDVRARGRPYFMMFGLSRPCVAGVGGVLAESLA